MKSAVKKVSIKLVAKEEFAKDDLMATGKVISLDEFSESHIKHEDFLSGYSFEFLKDNAMMFGQGIWMTVKGFAGMAGWAFIIIFEGLKYIWSKAFGGKQNGEEKKE